MSDIETFDLGNVDPDEISGVLGKVEKSFGFKFGKTYYSTNTLQIPVND
ncbi:MAG TPA: hypothetical protein VL088_07340 [Pedobacter sp.]|nr:hypothetical protein [Pedobacter sp.]